MCKSFGTPLSFFSDFPVLSARGSRNSTLARVQPFAKSNQQLEHALSPIVEEETHDTAKVLRCKAFRALMEMLARQIQVMKGVEMFQLFERNQS